MRQMTLGILLLVLALLIGCDSKVYGYEIEGYQKACEAKGGVAHVNNFSGRAICKNGSTAYWKLK